MIKDLFLNNKILVAVAHNDDIEFIMGGVLSSMSKEINQDEIKMKFITFASREDNTKEEFKEVLNQQKKSFSILGIKKPDITNYKFRARFLPSHDDDIRLALKKVKQEMDPNIIITHYKNDPHQDHSCLYGQVLRVFTDRTIVGGEISNSGTKMNPNLFIGVEREDIENKAEALSQYKQESYKYYFKKDLLLSLARVRGAQSGCYYYAEAFEIYAMHTGVDINLD